MPDYADLEIGLHRYDEEAYTVDLRFNLPGDEEEKRASGRAQFQLDQLDALSDDDRAYGEMLYACLFGDEALSSAYAGWAGRAQEGKVPLRMRLAIDSSAANLHSLHWEKLRDPHTHAAFGIDENQPLTRYLGSPAGGSVRLVPKAALKALVVVANPQDLAGLSLAPLDVAGELNRARAALQDIPVSVLPDGTPGSGATLQNILDRQRDGAFDILYLVCHGALGQAQEARLYLEDETGATARISGSVFVERLMALQQRPMLVVLASCESAGKGTGPALGALGPRLAEAGIPAVLAIQGKISLETAGRFMPAFFRALLADGQLDRALAAARGAVRDRPDYWMPALYMRLKRGRIWYQPGFAGSGELERWDALVGTIEVGKCTPIIGPGLFEPLLGPQREIANQWAEKHRYPLESHDRDSLPQVAQYLAVKKSRSYPFIELQRHLKSEILRLYRDRLPEGLRDGLASYDELLEAAAGLHWETAESEAYRVLARMPLPIFITTNLNTLLAAALRDAGKDPQVVLCPWYEGAEKAQNIFTTEPGYRPSVKRPLVFHMFGLLDEPETAVLTEDDYFNFLIGVTRNRDLIPPLVQPALTNRALLFLGYQLDAWNFQVLLRFILSLEGVDRAKDYPHIAAQIEPEEGRILEPQSARRYLEDYFSKDTGINISIFWGTTGEFLKGLAERLQAASA